jgi:hypothetical protein
MGDEARLLSLHPLLPWIDRALTVLMWREGALSPKVRGLRNVLTAHAAHRTGPPTLGRTAGDQIVWAVFADVRVRAQHRVRRLEHVKNRPACLK